MNPLSLQDGIIYGPIRSRRLGRSLGVNVLPCDYKLCSFDCIYCHYGRTEVKSTAPSREHFPAAREVLAALERTLRNRQDFAAITFSGNGEPTLHPDFAELAAGARALRDRHAPLAKLVLLSNSSTAHRPGIREALGHFDLPVMKLDAGDARTLSRVNRPAAQVGIEEITGALRLVPNLTVQSVIVAGHLGNADDEAVERWLEALARIRPRAVQIYSSDRPVAETGVERVLPDDLQDLAGRVQARTRADAQAFWCAG